MIQLRSPDNVPVILASASPRRAVLLAQMGLVPSQIVPADIDETPLPAELPAPYARRMAFEKTAVIAKAYPEAYVIGADTVVACGRRILPKAEAPDTALQCMKLLMGRAHRVYGGIALAKPAHLVKHDPQIKNDRQIKHDPQIIVKSTYSNVAMRRLDDKEMADYITHADWDGKAGGYAIQGAAAQYITKISGSYSQIMGLDIYQLSAMLKAASFRQVSIST